MKPKKEFLLVQRIRRNRPGPLFVVHVEWIVGESATEALKYYVKNILQLTDIDYKIFLEKRLARTIYRGGKNSKLVGMLILTESKKNKNWREELKTFLEEEKILHANRPQQPELQFN